MIDIDNDTDYVMTIILNRSDGDDLKKYFTLMDKAEELGISRSSCGTRWMRILTWDSEKEEYVN